MPSSTLELTQLASAISREVRSGLAAKQKNLSAWLFYDEAGSRLFEQITEQPEYYLTRTERALSEAHADEIFPLFDANLTIAELGAGTATKTGILLRAATRLQRHILYQPIDISESALEEARASIQQSIPGVTVRPQVANYVTDSVTIQRPSGHRILALYIGSSIGNFAPPQATAILSNLRSQLRRDDALLLGTDLAPAARKSVAALSAAYNDSRGVTAAFNLNMLARLNRDLGTDFDLKAFRHRAIWNRAESRIEMHLESLKPQNVRLPADSDGPACSFHFQSGETIHTENSYKFTEPSILALLASAGFAPARTFIDAQGLFAVTLATVIDEVQ